MQLQVSLPIYYTIHRKTKKSSTHLVGDNFIRNAHYHIKNDIKQHYHQLVEQQLSPHAGTPAVTFTLTMQLYYKSPVCDPSNIYHQLEKYFLDAIQDLNYVVNDTVLNHLGTSTLPAICDKLNPRCIITLELHDPAQT